MQNLDSLFPENVNKSRKNLNEQIEMFENSSKIGQLKKDTN